MMTAEGRRYRAVTYDEIPELKRAIRGIPEPFRVADVVPRLPEGMQDLEPRELGRALLSRGLCVSVGFDQATRSALLSRVSKDGVGNHETEERKQGRDGSMKCHTQNCTNQAQEGSSYCEECYPNLRKNRKASEELEAAEARVKLAEETKEKLHQEVMRKHGALSDLASSCKNGSFTEREEAKELRKKYNAANEELRLAKQDLEYVRESDRQKATEEKIRNKPCDRCGYLRNGPMCLACGPANDYAEFVTKPAAESDKGDVDTPVEETRFEIPPNSTPELVEQQFEKAADTVAVVEGKETDTGEDWGMFKGEKTEVSEVPEEECQGEPVKREPYWKGGPLDTVNGYPWSSAIGMCPPGSIIVLLPGLYSWGAGEKEESIQLGEELELEIDDPSFWTPEKVIDYIATIEEEDEEEIDEGDPNYVSAQGKLEEGKARKGQTQMSFDTEGGMKPAPVAIITHKPKAVPVEIKLTDNKWKVNTTEEGLDNIAEKDRDEIRNWVIPKLKVLKDATIREGDFDEAVETMVAIILEEVPVEHTFGGKQASPAVKTEA